MERRVKIMFVDDEARIVKLLRMMFRSRYDVLTATSGSEALQMLADESIDIIVSDQRMPGMTGIELLSQVRERWPNTIRILLTGYADLVAIIGAVNDGEVYRFLNKPWNHDEIKAVIDECASIALSAEQVLAKCPKPVIEPPPPLASAAKLLTVDGIDSDRHEVMEMFTEDYDVIGTSSVQEALEIVERHEIGVIVADIRIGEEKTIEFLREVKRRSPFLTIVMLSSAADSDLIINLINKAHIYRFAMKPICPNVFRLAVSAAMREHHRLLADPTVRAARAPADADDDPMVDSIVGSLRRFVPLSPADMGATRER